MIQSARRIWQTWGISTWQTATLPNAQKRNEVMLDKVTKINAFNVAQFAYMVKKMASLKEGSGTLLDNCIMMWGWGLENGNDHTRKNLPLILAGKGGGSLKSGCYLPDVKGNQADLVGTLLTCAGIPLDRPIGIAEKQLPALAPRLLVQEATAQTPAVPD